LDLILKPLCKEVPSFVRDDIDFLQKLPETVTSNATLVSFDIVSLYTNIPHELGIQAVQYWLSKNKGTIDTRFDQELIIDALKIVLQRNIFYFNGNYYIQKSGTAMGTKMAPTYATLVLGYLEEILRERMREKYGETFAVYLKNNWKRFLDDCFIIWTENIPIEAFFAELNNLHPAIKFTMNTSDTSLPFLDVLVMLKENKIITDIYCKPTDTHVYLNFHSSHPKHTKINIPFNLASRIITIVKDEDLRGKRLAELRTYLRKQNYPDELISSGINRARMKGPILNTERRKNDEVCDLLPFVNTYNTRNTSVFPSIRSCQEFLKQSGRMRKVLQNKKVINCTRQPKSLKQILTKSRFDLKEAEAKVTKCGKPRCLTCPDLIEAGSVTFKNGKVFHVKTDMNCKSKNVIYAVICQQCEEFYIGQTSMELRLRMTLHRQQTRVADVRFLKVSKHFHQCSKGKFKVFPIYKLFNNNTFELEEKEQYFIRMLEPGLNT
ncbi:hypothetical protein BOW49_13320, partial [Solemya velum gill symbiont]|uniref:GIY-YIG nuclease family protein n=3 Tax=Solemya velum gill symbiont TaxID=2340 RepID=UPI0009C460D7